MSEFSIASWNVNSIRARLENVLEWVKEAAPDVLLLQEIKVVSENFPYEHFADLGYQSVVYGQKTYNGVAIVSKLSIEDIQYGFFEGNETQEARYLEAIVGGSLRVASVYVPNGQSVGSDKFRGKLAFLDNLYEHLRRLLTYNEVLLVGGDYNIAPQDRDVYDPARWHEEVLCSTVERQQWCKLLHLGFSDVWRSLHPTERDYTWWDYRQNAWLQNHGLRIDHFLASPQAMDQIIAVHIDPHPRSKTRPSDHAPIICKIEV